jgi:hypothetical protein
MTPRDINCVTAVIILSNFDRNNPSSLKLVDNFVSEELPLEETDLIAAFAFELSSRHELVPRNFFASYEAFKGTLIGEQLIILFKLLGKLGQRIMSAKPSLYGDMLLESLKLYDLNMTAID